MRALKISGKLRHYTLHRSLLGFVLLVCLTFLAVKVGFRPVYIGTDTAVYLHFYDGVVSCGCNPSRFEPLFYMLARINQLLGFDSAYFLTLVSVVQFFSALLLASALGETLGYSPRRRFSFILFYLAGLLVSPFFFAIQTNILRQGCAALIVALAFTFAARGKWRAAVLWFVVACLLHYSSLLYLPFIWLFKARLRTIALSWLGLCIAYVLGVTRWFVSILPGVAGFRLYDAVSFYGENAAYNSGIRLDFMAVTIAPVVFFVIVNWLAPSVVSRERAKLLLPIYAALTFPFLFFGWAAFSDRYAYAAWVFMPALLSVVILRLANRLSTVIGLASLVLGAGYFYLTLSNVY